MCGLYPGVVSASFLFSVLLCALTVGFLCSVLPLCGVSGTQTGLLLGCMPARELGIGATMLSNLLWATGPFPDSLKCCGIFGQLGT